MCDDAWRQLAALQQVRHNLELDLEDKSQALDIDLDQLRLSSR